LPIQKKKCDCPNKNHKKHCLVICNEQGFCPLLHAYDVVVMVLIDDDEKIW